MDGRVHARDTRAVIPSRTVCDLVVVGPYEGGAVTRLRTVSKSEFGKLSTPPGPWCPDCARHLLAEAASVRRDADDASSEELEAASDLLDRLRRE